jgi:hypothetical protein
MSYGRKHFTNKWLKTKALLIDKSMRAYVPVTKIMSRATLHDMLHKYGMVFVKPIAGTFGTGVMRVDREQNGNYRFQSGRKVKSFTSFDEMHRSLSKHKTKRTYLVQKGIRLIQHGGRPFDIRVMVQRNPRREWVTTGIIGRVAQRGKVVTNYHNGGKPTSLEQLLVPKIGAAKTKAYAKLLSTLGRRSAIVLSRTFKKIDSIGADIGIDRRFAPSIIELNTNPDPYLFRHLKDKTTHRRVLRYARALGRVKTASRRGAVRKRKR